MATGSAEQEVPRGLGAAAVSLVDEGAWTLMQRGLARDEPVFPNDVMDRGDEKRGRQRVLASGTVVQPQWLELGSLPLLHRDALVMGYGAVAGNLARMCLLEQVMAATEAERVGLPPGVPPRALRALMARERG